MQSTSGTTRKRPKVTPAESLEGLRLLKTLRESQGRSLKPELETLLKELEATQEKPAPAPAAPSQS